ncbi:hypothetical protein GJ744_008117 [Endocarpon pusillum]|uniref:Uncharacterized protein n=1 Tax=Endocarpon pusillum TaxID=364733 RepID=A0A8H7E3P8_9EURO|nr:hypothetical protein GJ744_008117 [Endocarpon pusillum]
MHKPTLLVALATVSTTVVYAQNRCQMFISHLPGDNPIASVPDAGEITQGCAVSSVDPAAADKNAGGDCKTLGTFAVDIKKDITVAKDVTGLDDDVRIFIFNRNLKEGFVKYKAADLNFEDFNQCLTTLDGSLDFNVRFQRCEFDCP